MGQLTRKKEGPRVNPETRISLPFSNDSRTLVCPSLPFAVAVAVTHLLRNQSGTPQKREKTIDKKKKSRDHHPVY